MSAIKFRKCLTKFKITIALSKKFGSKGFITVVKVMKICRSSGESNKLRYVYPIRGSPGVCNPAIAFVLCIRDAKNVLNSDFVCSNSGYNNVSITNLICYNYLKNAFGS